MSNKETTPPEKKEESLPNPSEDKCIKNNHENNIEQSPRNNDQDEKLLNKKTKNNDIQDVNKNIHFTENDVVQNMYFFSNYIKYGNDKMPLKYDLNIELTKLLIKKLTIDWLILNKERLTTVLAKLIFHHNCIDISHTVSTSFVYYYLVASGIHNFSGKESYNRINKLIVLKKKYCGSTIKKIRESFNGHVSKTYEANKRVFFPFLENYLGFLEKKDLHVSQYFYRSVFDLEVAKSNFNKLRKKEKIIIVSIHDDVSLYKSIQSYMKNIENLKIYIFSQSSNNVVEENCKIKNLIIRLVCYIGYNFSYISKINSVESSDKYKIKKDEIYRLIKLYRSLIKTNRLERYGVYTEGIIAEIESLFFNYFFNYYEEKKDGSHIHHKNVYQLIGDTYNVIDSDILYLLFKMSKKNGDVSLYGCFQRCYQLKEIKFLEKFDTSTVVDMNIMFLGCNNLTIIDLSSFNTSNVTNMGGLFEGCSKLTAIDLSSFNTTKVTNMCYMFFGCSSLKDINLLHFDTSSVTDMSWMFYGCISLIELTLKSFNTQNVTDISQMFNSCHSLVKLDISSFNTSKVTNMTGLFHECYKLEKIDLSSFDTSHVTNMSYMFYECQKVEELDLTSFNTSNVHNMGLMFHGCSSLSNIVTKSFDTSNVTNMSQMFRECQNLIKIDLSSFNTLKVTNMSWMFDSCLNLVVLDLSSFNTSNVTNMRGMFKKCVNLKKLDLPLFDTTKVTNKGDIFTECNNIKTVTVNNYNVFTSSDLPGEKICVVSSKDDAICSCEI